MGAPKQYRERAGQADTLIVEAQPWGFVDRNLIFGRFRSAQKAGEAGVFKEEPRQGMKEIGTEVG